MNNNNNNKLYKQQTSNYYQMPTTTTTTTINKYEYNSNSNTSSDSYNNRLNINYYGNDNETFSFQDFISLIINENDVKLHKLIIQDLERILELKFREFKKLFSSSYLNLLLNNQTNNNNNNNNNNQQQQSQSQSQSQSKSTKLQICSPNDLFTKISRDIFKTSLDEPNGILGARINMKFLYDGKLIDICRFDYDPCTLTTFEVVVIIKEDVRSIKKLLHAFKLYSNFGKYFTIYIDENNYEFYKRKLY